VGSREGRTRLVVLGSVDVRSQVFQGHLFIVDGSRRQVGMTSEANRKTYKPLDRAAVQEGRHLSKRMMGPWPGGKVRPWKQLLKWHCVGE